jgi:hypothetical protein
VFNQNRYAQTIELVNVPWTDVERTNAAIEETFKEDGEEWRKEGKRRFFCWEVKRCREKVYFE